MTVTPDSAAATIAFIAPGFVLLSVFYWLGLQTKRSDAQWVVWSVIASAAIRPLTTVFPGQWQTLGAFGIAVLGGLLLSGCWRQVAKRSRGVTGAASIRAWDTVMARAAWLQVEMADGRTFKGLLYAAAASVDTDDLDLYLTRVSEVVDGEQRPLDAHGVLLRRADVRIVVAFPWANLPMPQQV